MKPEKRSKKKVTMPEAAAALVRFAVKKVVSLKKDIMAHPTIVKCARKTKKCKPC